MKKIGLIFLLSLTLLACQKKSGDKNSPDGGEPNDPISNVPSGLVYTENNLSLNKRSTISTLRPSYFGTPNSFSISPALPLGLSFDTATGYISGTPLVEMPATVYTVRASNSLGSDDTTLTISVKWSLPKKIKTDLSVGGLATLKPTVVAGEKLFFGSDENGGELWVSDGTETGTVKIKSFNSQTIPAGPQQLTAVGNVVYFIGNSVDEGYELWKSDGTVAGTVLVKDIKSGNDSSNIKNLTAYKENLFFSADDGISGPELWRSDGTSGGTVLVKNINIATSLEPKLFMVVGNNLYFVVDDGINGEELWISDGTNANTHIVADLSSGNSGSSPRLLTAIGEELFFKADSGNGEGSELYKTDGNSISLVADIVAGPSGSSIENLFNFNGIALFSAYTGTTGRELYMSDGTSASLVEDIVVGIDGSNPYGFTKLNENEVVFAADSSVGIELLKYNILTDNLSVISDLNPGAGDSTPSSFVNLNGMLYFMASSPFIGNELYRTNGDDIFNLIQDLTSNGSSIFEYFNKRVNLDASEDLFFFHKKNNGKYDLYLLKP